MSALAQANACDQLKATLAARIEATGVRGYQLEVVSSATPVPAGAKAIGNCEGGARKVLYRRWGGAPASASVEAAPAPAPAPAVPPPAAVAPEPRAKPQPVARPSAAAPVVSVVVPTPTPVAAPVLPVAVAAEPIKAPPARAAEVDVVPKANPVLAQEAPSIAAEPPADKPPLSQRIAGFVSVQWRWLLVLLLVPLALLGWAWRAHHLAYDRNGLPRGPRL